MTGKHEGHSDTKNLVTTAIIGLSRRHADSIVSVL